MRCFKYEYYNNGVYVSFKNVSTLESLYVTSVQKEMALNNISIYNIVILILAV